jgi:hypothetical protein
MHVVTIVWFRVFACQYLFESMYACTYTCVVSERNDCAVSDGALGMHVVTIVCFRVFACQYLFESMYACTYTCIVSERNDCAVSDCALGMHVVTFVYFWAGLCTCSVGEEEYFQAFVEVSRLISC